jgi:ribosomal protein S13
MQDLGEKLREAKTLEHLLSRVGYVFWNLCELEDTLIQLRLAKLTDLRGIGVEVAREVERELQQHTMGAHIGALRKAGTLSEENDRRLAAILKERNWLAHHAKRESRGVIHSTSKLSALLARLEAIGEETLSLNQTLAGEVLSHFKANGVSAEAADQELTRILAEWGMSPERIAEIRHTQSDA